MSPVNLGTLGSNVPAATGRCQIKRAPGNNSVNYSAGVAGNTVLSDGAGGQMSMSITTGQQPGWWVIRAETIWLTDGTWYYFTWNVILSPADADGMSQAWNHLCLHPALGWQESCIDTIFRLQANTTYTVSMCWGYSQGGTQALYAGPDFTYLLGEFVGEGQI
jgi:hypothetical protein